MQDFPYRPAVHGVRHRRPAGCPGAHCYALRCTHAQSDAARGASGRVGDAEVQCQNRCTQCHAVHAACYAHASTWRGGAAATTSSREKDECRCEFASPRNCRTRCLPRPGTGRRRSVNPGHLALPLLFFFPPGGFKVIVRVTREVRSNELSEGDGKQGSQKVLRLQAKTFLSGTGVNFFQRKIDLALKN